MKVKYALLTGLILAAVVCGCRNMIVPGAEVTEQGTIVFVAEGTSVVAKSGDPLALLEARTAAKTIALANLLEKVKGSYVSSNVMVGDLMFAHQEAASSVEGFLSRAEVSFRKPEAKAPETQMVTAIAMLELSKDDLENLAGYVE
ncbi:MAG: hypothetical protein PVJ27_04570 [Candidatus Brocadiaceae bacterium]|jgi:hypothetical protein